MGSGKRKYYKRAIYIPKNHVVDASKKKVKKEGKKKPPMGEFLEGLKK